MPLQPLIQSTVRVVELSGFALNVAVEMAEGFEVDWYCERQTGVRKLDGLVVGTVRDFVGQGPIADDIMDRERICTEIAGDGWAALRNDCFCPATYYKAAYGATRREAAMRCYVRHALGDLITLPDAVTAHQHD